MAVTVAEYAESCKSARKGVSAKMRAHIAKCCSPDGADLMLGGWETIEWAFHAGVDRETWPSRAKRLRPPWRDNGHAIPIM